MTKEVKTVTEKRKEDQTVHVHVGQTSDDKDEIDSNEDFPIIRENTSVPNSEQRNPQERQKRRENDSEFDVWIVGASVVKDLNPKLMYKNRKVRRTTLWDKTVAGAIDFVKPGKIKSKTILFQKGSNDLDHLSEDELMKEIEQMVKVTREMYPESNVVYTEILPRFYRDMNMLTQYNQKRRLFNNLLKDYCKDLELAIVNFGDYFDIDSFYDGIHLNQKEINVYVSQVKRVLSPIMGMDIPPKQSQSSLSSNTQSHVVDRKYRPDLSRNGYVQER